MIKVLIVDDSAVVRSKLQEILDAAPDIRVVATASDPYFARDKFKSLEPDVITLDVEMPRMDGLTFLDKLMAYKPTPVVMISTLTQKGAETTLKALALGAVDFVAKPTGNLSEKMEELAKEIVEKVRIAARSHPRRRARPSRASTAQAIVAPRIGIDDVIPLNLKASLPGTAPVFCVGASTGGTVAIEQLLLALPKNIPGTVIVQHMPAGYTRAFAARLDGLCDLEIVEGENGMEVVPGRVIIAPGGTHTLLQRGRLGYYVQIKDGPPVNRHKPSVDVLFRSAANTAGARGLGILLTGMGDDGARGLLDMYKAGAYTIAQDEQSSVVFGMPKIAIDMGAASSICSLDAIPRLLITRLQTMFKANA